MINYQKFKEQKFKATRINNSILGKFSSFLKQNGIITQATFIAPNGTVTKLTKFSLHWTSIHFLVFPYDFATFKLIYILHLRNIYLNSCYQLPKIEYPCFFVVKWEPGLKNKTCFKYLEAIQKLFSKWCLYWFNFS